MAGLIQMNLPMCYIAVVAERCGPNGTKGTGPRLGLLDYPNRSENPRGIAANAEVNA